MATGYYGRQYHDSSGIYGYVGRDGTILESLFPRYNRPSQVTKYNRVDRPYSMTPMIAHSLRRCPGCLRGGTFGQLCDRCRKLQQERDTVIRECAAEGIEYTPDKSRVCPECGATKSRCADMCAACHREFEADFQRGWDESKARSEERACGIWTPDYETLYGTDYMDNGSDY